MTLDPNALMDVNGQPVSAVQSEHIRRFNDAGRIMAAMPDYYEAGKSGDDGLIQSLRVDFDKSWIVSGTHICYDSDSLEGVVAHYFNSIVVPSVETRLVIPYYSCTPLDSVLGDEQGLAFFQTLFNTSDGADEIRSALQNLSGKSSGAMWVWTPDQDGRRSHPDRAAGLNWNNVDFHIDCDNVGSLGRSRGVLSGPAGAAREKSRDGTQKSAQGFASELTSGIDRKSACVYFSDVRRVGGFVKYSGMFCFDVVRYVLALTCPVEKASVDDVESWGRRISALLAKKVSNRERLDMLHDVFSPMYACLQEYARKDDAQGGFVLVSKEEGFDNPRVDGERRR